MFFSDCAPKKGFVVAVTSKSTIKNSGRKKVLIFSPVVSLNASVVPLLPASSSCSLADLLFLMYLEKYFQKKKKLQNIFLAGFIIVLYLTCWSLCYSSSGQKQKITVFHK